jgi:outer membrane protein assembly factor BamB
MQQMISALAVGLAFTTLTGGADWPQWRGPNRDGISKETGLLQEWPQGGPALRWKSDDIGTGYSSPAIVKGRVYVQTTKGNDEFTLALDETNGKEVWSTAIGKVGQNRGPQYPGTRSTPTIDGDSIYCLASNGELVSLNAADGKINWQKQLRDDFSGQPGNWAYTESVLIDGDALVCTPGGAESPIVALNKKTGETIWTASGVPDMGTAEYASLMVVDDGKSKQYVTFLRKGVVAVDAKTGKFLWRYDRTIDQGANILTPVISGNRVFSSGSRSAGGTVEIKPEGAGFEPHELYLDRGLSASIGGAVLIDGTLYGTSPQAMFCADFATGKIHWTERALGNASICYADGRLYVRGHQSGDVALVEPSHDGYREKGRIQQPDRSGKAAWPHPVVANGGLYLRDQGALLCYDVKAK